MPEQRANDAVKDLVSPGKDTVIAVQKSLNFRQTKLAGVFEIDIEPKPDERGFFARTWCQREFEAYGLDSNLVQCSVSFNLCRGTLRGMHYQAAPYGETKLVRCTRGSIYDVVVDLRPQSSSYLQWISAVLTADNHKALYIPEECAHGFLTLEDTAEVFYQMSDFYQPEAARGVRWDDAAFGIAWPAEVAVISERDRAYPDYRYER